MNIQELQKLTVAELRKIAKESHIKLSAGIDKAGIVQRIMNAQGDAEESAPAETELISPPLDDQIQMKLELENESVPAESESPEKNSKEEFDALGASFDVTSAAPEYRQWVSQQSAGYRPQSPQPTAWQSRSAQQASRPVPAWQQRSAPHRFGPQQRSTDYTDSVSVAQQSKADNLPTVTSDGYRLGYRAAPQRSSYQQRDRSADNDRSPRPYQPRNTYGGDNRPPARYPSADSPTNDTLYRMNRNPEFDEQRAQGVTPTILQTAEMVQIKGILEIMPDGYGFLRSPSLKPSKSDIYMAPSLNQRYGLRVGDTVEGQARKQRPFDKYSALLTVDTVNGLEAREDMERPVFDQLTACNPERRVILEKTDEMTIRLLDLITPLGFGQRALLQAPPECGSLKLLTELGKTIKENNPDTTVIMLLIDAAPEDVTEIRDSVDTEIFCTSYVDLPEVQTRLSETILEYAERKVEIKQNVVLLVDSLTKLAKAYHCVMSPAGRTAHTSISKSAIAKPKRLFGSARNVREGGSLTVIATVQIDSDSRTDEIILEDMKDIANLNLILCRPSDGDSVFPMIDLQKSETKKENLLLDDRQKEALYSIRSMSRQMSNQQAVAQLIGLMKKTNGNTDLLNRFGDWKAILDTFTE